MSITGGAETAFPCVRRHFDDWPLIDCIIAVYRRDTFLQFDGKFTTLTDCY